MSESPTVETLGYVLLGIFFSLWFSGILSYQTLYFYTNYPSERKWLKVFVGILVLADGVQTIMGVAIIWEILIRHFNDMKAIKESTRLFQIYPVLIGSISSSVQIFFAWRIKVLSMNHILFAVIVVLAVPQFAAGIAYTILTVKVGYIAEFWNFNSVIIGWVGSSIACDIVITTTLTMILRRHRANQNLGAATHLVHRVIMMSINNGLVTILWSLALLITVAVTRRGAHNMFFYPLAKVYLITMLASLNSRPIVRPELDPRIHSVLQRSSTPRPTTPNLYLLRPPVDHGEKPPSASRGSNHMRTASRITEYLPMTQEEDESKAQGQREERRLSDGSADEGQRGEGRPSDGSADEGRPLVREPSLKQPTSPPRPARHDRSSVSSRPRGPRLPVPPSSAARRLSA